MERCSPEPGAIAAVLRRHVCIHVAVVIDTPEGLRVLEINPKKGAKVCKLAQFEAQYMTVEYYRDRPSLPLEVEPSAG